MTVLTPATTPSPDPGGNLGPFGGGGGGSATTDTSADSSTDTAGAPQQFVNAVVARLRYMIGSKGYLADDATLQGIADKLWQQDTGIQQAWENYTGSTSGQQGQAFAGFLTQLQRSILESPVDPTIFTDYIDAKQSTGTSLSAAELNALAQNSQAISAVVPKPFDTSFVSGYDWGQPLPAALAESTGWKTHLGVDYGTPAGSRIVSPFAGTIKIVHDPWRGNAVQVVLDNKWIISFGHVGSIPVTNGARVNPGDLIAISGQNVGISQGAVTLVEWFDPQGHPQNPHDVLDPIFKGTTFGGLPGIGSAAQQLAGSGQPTVNSVLDNEYPGIKNAWQKYFGTRPSPGDVYNVLAHGNSPQQWEDYIRAMNSHIEGLNVGQAYDLRSLADSYSLHEFGHQSNDYIVKQLFDQHMTGDAEVKLFYANLSDTQEAAMDKITYDQMYKANNDITQSIFLDSAHPQDIVDQYKSIVARLGPDAPGFRDEAAAPDPSRPQRSGAQVG